MNFFSHCGEIISYKMKILSGKMMHVMLNYSASGLSGIHRCAVTLAVVGAPDSAWQLN